VPHAAQGNEVDVLVSRTASQSVEATRRRSQGPRPLAQTYAIETLATISRSVVFRIEAAERGIRDQHRGDTKRARLERMVSCPRTENQGSITDSGRSLSSVAATTA
jgi:hypothetical protein